MTTIPEGYEPQLSLYDTQRAIERLRYIFLAKLCAALHLVRVTAPLIVDPKTGMNDNLNGVERPVGFDVPAIGSDAEVVQSLAKWKRYALKRYDFNIGKGVVCNMNAIRRDEEIDNLHSIYVDQWDWEKVIDPDQRTTEYLHEVVGRIVTAISGTLDELKWQYPQLETHIDREITFITSQELEDLYPDLTPKERENRFVAEHHTTFIQGIGAALKSGQPHDGRAPDYDDWALNGDLLFWNDVLGCAFEVSSMGIRVNPESLDRQLTIAGCDDRRELPFHKMLLAGELPLTIGGGIGQSRLCMLLLGKAHVGEVQASVWDAETLEACQAAGIQLL
ncbi:MAG: aspartate--ammonia ligase [Coriobacteriia bacterium]|nr:aspartate--ammonia ligase [Coriobacteriia bacterium]